MLRSTTPACAHYHGTRLIRSDDSLALTILRAIEEGVPQTVARGAGQAPVAVANFLMNASASISPGSRRVMACRCRSRPIPR